jgi:hypothetical protein
MTVRAKLVLLAMPLMLTACQTTTPTSVIDTSCLAMEPITYSRKDTAATAAQIRQHNAAYKSLCRQ